MPILNRNAKHQCPFCNYSSRRDNLKQHLTSEGKKGLRCTGLKKVIPSDFWTTQILPHYTRNAKLGDLSEYLKLKKSPGKKKKDFKDIKFRKNKKKTTFR